MQKYNSIKNCVLLFLSNENNKKTCHAWNQNGIWNWIWPEALFLFSEVWKLNFKKSVCGRLMIELIIVILFFFFCLRSYVGHLHLLWVVDAGNGDFALADEGIVVDVVRQRAHGCTWYKGNFFFFKQKFQKLRVKAWSALCKSISKNNWNLRWL